MFNIIFTLDYEIHGNGDGSPYDLMVEPTSRIINLFNKYGAKLTIMADVAEILKFKEYKDLYIEDKYNYTAIIKQLKDAIANNHDVQLHIHSGYFNSEFLKNGIKQNWDEYDLANLTLPIIHERISLCKRFLEEQLKPVDLKYDCIAFRAANWSMVPTRNIYTALAENNIEIDTSVFKYGKRNGRVVFDYSYVPDKLIPWFFDENDINKINVGNKILEIPIYCELRNVFSFITVIRAFRMIRSRFHLHEKQRKDNLIEANKKSNSSLIKLLNKVVNLSIQFTIKHAWKLDFNQASSRQIINALKRIDREYGHIKQDLPIVLIGHSKSFIKFNEFTIEPLLKYIKENPEKYKFSIFKDIKTEAFRYQNYSKPS